MTRVLLGIVSVLLLAGCTWQGPASTDSGGGGTPPEESELAPALQSPRPISDVCRDALTDFGQAAPDDAAAGLVVTDECATWDEVVTVVTENPAALGYASAEEIDEKALAQRVCAEPQRETSLCLEVARIGLLTP